jgi:Ala-tRNA(Pro) deacylase
MNVFERLCTKLDAANVPYVVEEHAPVFTSAEAAEVRGVAMASGAKALLVRVDAGYVLCIMPADRKLDSKQVKKLLKVKSIRFATKEELLEITGLEPGAVPPFGSLFNVPTLVDPALKEQPFINFNAGDHAKSIRLAIDNYLKAEEPRLVELSLPAS